MIKLLVKDYCHNCPEFEPHFSKTEWYGDTSWCRTDTDITCKHAERCKEIKRYLEKEIKK